MKFTIALAFVAAATFVSAESNAQRFARGLPPNSPMKRGTPVAHARRSQPSGSPGGGECTTGPVQCCDSHGEAGNNDQVDDLLNMFNVNAEPGTKCGVSCSPWNGVGIGESGSNCQQEPVCCDNNSFNGIIVVGCSPINIYL